MVQLYVVICRILRHLYLTGSGQSVSIWQRWNKFMSSLVVSTALVRSLVVVIMRNDSRCDAQATSGMFYPCEIIRFVSFGKRWLIVALNIISRTL